MIKIISPELFKKIPWKNGKGQTTELAINNGGTLENFDWRLSMASVVEDGEFSDFTGYLRNLVLISGNGIDLQHDQSGTDRLDRPLTFATFNGGCKTVGILKSGPVTDFNLISRTDKYQVTLETHITRQDVTLHSCTLCFIYCLNEAAAFTSQDNNKNISLPAGHLMQLTQSKGDKLQVNGKDMIVIHLNALK